MDISKKLKDRRKELNLTMLQVAQKAGVSEATISRWESGDIANMRRDKIVSLANALQVSPSFVMGDISSEEKQLNPSILTKYNKLNPLGQQKTDAYVDDLLENPKYTKETPHTPTLADHGTIAALGGGVKTPKRKPKVT